MPAPARALDRVEGAGLRLLREVAPASGRRRLREVPAEPRRDARRAARRARRRARGRARRARRRRRAVARLAARRRRVSRGGRRTTASSGPSPTCSPGRRSTSARRSRELLWDDGPTAVLVSATLAGRRRLRLRPRSGSGCARRARSPSARPSTTASRRSSTCRAAFPTRGPTTRRARRRGGRRACRISPAARSC